MKKAKSALYSAACLEVVVRIMEYHTPRLSGEKYSSDSTATAAAATGTKKAIGIAVLLE